MSQSDRHHSTQTPECTDILQQLQTIADEPVLGAWLETTLRDVMTQLDDGEYSPGKAADRLRKLMDYIWNDETVIEIESTQEKARLVDELEQCVVELSLIHNDLYS